MTTERLWKFVELGLNYRQTSRNLIISPKSILWDPISLIRYYLVKSPTSLFNSICQGSTLKEDDYFKVPEGFPIKWKYFDVRSIASTISKVALKFSFKDFTRGSRKLPLPESEVCKFVGYLPFKVSSRGIECAYSNKDFDNYVVDAGLQHKFGGRKVLPEKVMLGGGISSILPNLSTMATPPVKKFSYEEMIEAVSLRAHQINLPTMPEPQASWIDSVKVNVKAFSGFFSSLFYGRTRTDTSEMSTIVAKDLFTRICNGRTHALELGKFGSRPKLVDLSENGKSLRSRPIAMCDDVLSKVCSVVSQPLMEGLVRSPYSEIFVGRSLGYDEARGIENHIGCKHTLRLCASPDGSQFDNHLYEEILVTAFSILRQCLPAGGKMNNLMYFICSSVVDKFVVVDPGLVFKLMKGLPSGHPFTSLVNTVSNGILWSTIFNNYCKGKGIPLNEEFRVVCSGDDTVVRLPYDVDIKFLQQCIDNSGMKIDPIETTLGLFNTTDGTNGISFLRRRWLSDGHLMGDYLYLVEKLRFPEVKYQGDVCPLIDRANDYLRMGSGLGSSTSLILDYIRHLGNQYFKNDAPLVNDIGFPTVEDALIENQCDYLMTVGLGRVRKEGGQLEHDSKMKILNSKMTLDGEYFATGLKTLKRLFWKKLDESSFTKNLNESTLNIHARFRRVIDERENTQDNMGLGGLGTSPP